MLSLVLTLLVAQTPAPKQEAPTRGLVVMVSRNEGLTAIEALTLADRLSKSLQDAQVKLAMSPSEAVARLGKRAPESCQGKSECLAALGRELGVSAVVGIDSSKIFDDLPMRITLIDTRQGQVLFKRSYTVSAVRPTELDTIFLGIGQELKKAVKDLPGFEQPPPDVPKATPPVDLAPKPVEPPPAAVAGLGEQPSPVPRYVFQGAAGAAALVAGTFAVLGLLQRGEFEQTLTGNTTALTWSQAQPRLSSINNNFTLAGALGVAAGALLVTSFALPGPPPPAQQPPAPGSP